MESHPYAQTRGVGVSPTSSSPLLDPSAASSVEVLPAPSVQTPASSRLCTRVNAKGGRCRMFASDDGSTLCPHHQRQELMLQRRQQEAAAKELLRDIENFSTADSVNSFLGNLVKQLARKRIERRDAIALAYISQLLLNSLSAVDKQIAAEKAEAEYQDRLRAITRQPRPNSPSALKPASG